MQELTVAVFNNEGVRFKLREREDNIQGKEGNWYGKEGT
jgi:hypothetical protein